MDTGNDQRRTQRNQILQNLTEDEARAHIERLRWPKGPACPHCGSISVYRMEGKTVRPGLLACRDCKGHFTVTVGTVMEDSHLPLATWIRAFHLVTSSKKGVSGLQLQRNLGLGSYRTAWHLAHRIREAMRCEPVAELLRGSVQCDEACVGGKPRKGTGKHKRGQGTSKAPVVALVETGGRVRSAPVQIVNADTLREAMRNHVHPSAFIVTDELSSYPRAAAGFAALERVNHSARQHVNQRGFHTNTAESYFALLKRGVCGTFHHVSRKHLGRYCNEFSFRWNVRKMTARERCDVAIRGIEGKRLKYQDYSA
ncbi:MAG: IS1595 family transposase [Phycisphaeraceae bacterium]|nr:IS1595 family transposase [Phycisphaeraceae bacterium]MBX3366356.1 IS1595 family transposase [Phycisphaeraceae bacterium]